MCHHLLEQYPDELVLLTTFGEAHPEILPARRARKFIAQISTGNAPDQVKKIFRKRFGRWFIHVPSAVDYLMNEDPLLLAPPSTEKCT